MEYPLDRRLKIYKGPAKGIDRAEEAVQNTSGRPDAIRYLYVDRILNKYPALPAKGWVKGADTMIRYISAIGFFFAKEIFEQTNVPIGIISSSWGGTRVEQWTQPAAYQSSPVFGKIAASTDTFKIDGLKPGQMFRGMIAPMIPFAIKGVLWYQGESNCIIEDQDTYVEKMKVMENDWRHLFRDAQLPFYTVQIAPCLYSERKDAKSHTPELLPAFWEAQTLCTQLPRTYMVVTTDLVDNLKDIHPSYKWVIAHRMARQALAFEYGMMNAEANSPAFASAKRKKNQLIVNFSNTGGGLQSSDGKELSWFTLAGEDGKFVPAIARIENNRIIVSAAGISKPKYVRFAWNERAMPNLVTKEGLPCVPFRTDKLK
jgi:sialate O-acetylesterase